MHHRNVCIAVIDEHQQVKSALEGLVASGFNAGQISVVGKDHPDDKHIHGYVTTGEQMKFWGSQGAFWGGMMGMLAGTGFLFVPGIGPLIVAGPLVSVIVGGLEGAVGLAGIEALFAGLVHLGFSKDGLAHFEKELQAGKSLVLVHGDADEAVRAKEVLSSAGFAVVTA
ncbi:MAG: general stress protein [Planctomycetota bacterium]